MTTQTPATKETMTMMIKNTNERFGECGTFEATSIDDLMADMDQTIVVWAKECDGNFDANYSRIRDEFRAGLEVVEPEGVKVGPGW